MSASTQHTLDPNSSKAVRFWSSNKDWRAQTHETRLLPPLPWPEMFEEYASPLPFVFLAALSSLSSLSEQPEWLVRDGLVPLIGFFSRYHRPPAGFRSKLLVHAQFERFVPFQWRRYCSFYTHEPFPEPGRLEVPLPVKMRTRWVFSCYIADTFCSLPYLRQVISDARKAPGITKEMMACPVRGHFAFGKSSFEFNMSFCAELTRAFMGEISSVTHSELRHFFDCRDSLILDLNEKLICADDLNLHIMLARGGIFPGPNRARQSGSRFVRLSPYHGFVVRAGKDKRGDAWSDGSISRLRQFLSEVQDLHPIDAFMLGKAPEWTWKVTRYRHLKNSL